MELTKNPVATYRLQINKNFTFSKAAEIVSYLASLGISHLYLSPVMKSVSGSLHGYDVEDFVKVSEERGGEAGLKELDKAAQENALHMILDIVPNHMGIAGENPYWFDVLKNGSESQHWSVFDFRVQQDGKLHLPVLDKSLEELIKHKDLKIMRHDDHGMVFSLKGRLFPLNETSISYLKNASLDMSEEDIQDILGRQHYQFTIWTESFDKINYRRFFDVMDLAGVRVEDEDVYRLSHQKFFDLTKKYPSISGVRIDHVDGLSNPARYLERLHQDYNSIWVEKILATDEVLPGSWPVEGTTGYEFIAFSNQVLINKKGFKELESYWKTLEPKWESFEDCVHACKGYVLDHLFSSELKRIVEKSAAIKGDQESAGIFWRSMTICLGVYRSYYADKGMSKEDIVRINQAALQAGQLFGEDFTSAAAIYMPMLLDLHTDDEKNIIRFMA